MNFFEKSKALKDAATKTPWEACTERGCPKCAISGNDDVDREYLVFCVNTHSRLCELLERALDKLELQGLNAACDASRIRDALDEMGKE